MTEDQGGARADEPCNDDGPDGAPCILKDLSTAMWAVAERRPGMENIRAVILLSDPDDPDGHDSISVFGYPRDDHPVQRVIEDMAGQLHEFADSFGQHVDIYVNGIRLTQGRASPEAS